jgi:glycosyltransferase involved in cell wall biosynthesis
MRVLHVFRTPVGGLFRHVRDLARGQAGLGHEVGIVCDSTTGGEMAAELLAQAAPFCRLGVKRIPISRMPGFGDLSGVRLVAAQARNVRPEIIHCHGAKGGLYGRLAGRLLGIPTVYTPHGGSLHYAWASPAGASFLAAEWLLARIGTAYHFVCDYEKKTYEAKLGPVRRPFAVIHNGLWPEEFGARKLTPDAAQLLFIGDMRELKGVDILLEAIKLLRPSPSACLVGDGPDLERFRALAVSLGVPATFAGRLPAAEAFRRGRILIMPSRAESFPYVVLEALAAAVPLIASDVGGIPEILSRDRLVPPGDASALAAAIAQALKDGTLDGRAQQDAKKLTESVSAARMVGGVQRLYAQLTAG